MYLGQSLSVTPTGAASLFTHSVFIDAIMLSLSEAADDKLNVDKFLDAYAYVSKSQQAPDELINYYINTIGKINETSLNVNNKEGLAAFSLRLSADAIQYPILVDVAEQIKRLTQESFSPTLVSILLNDCRRRVCSAVHANMLLKENAKQRSLIMSFGETGRDSDLLQIDSAAQNISSIVLNTRQSTQAITSIDSRDASSFIDALKRVEEKFTGGIVRTGITAINNFMGSLGGVIPGTTTVFAARSHNFKSGMLNKVPVWSIKFNNAPTYQDGKQPCMALISLENEADIIIRDICDDLYIDMYKTPVPATWTVEQKAHFIIGEFSKHGIVLKVERFQPEQFDADAYIQYCESLKASGLHPWIISLDYMAKMKTNPLMRSDEAITEVASRLCNYNKANNITCFTGHQLNREATAAIQMRTNQAKYFTEGMMASSSGPFREVDNVIFQNIEKNERGIDVLGMKWHKARYIKDVASINKYAVIPFLGKELGIVNDANDNEPLYAHDVNNIVFPQWFIDNYPTYSFGAASVSSLDMGDMAML